MDHIQVIDREKTVGLDRLLVDFLFILASGKAVEPDFRYEDQLDYYRKKIFGDRISLTALLDYLEHHKMSSRIAYPASPAQIRSRSFLIGMFAECTALYRLYREESFRSIPEYREFRLQCLENICFDDARSADIFDRELGLLYTKYTYSLTEADYRVFCDCFSRYRNEFEHMYQSVSASVMSGQSEAGKTPVLIKRSPFDELCRKYGIKDAERDVFRLQVDAVAEVQVCSNDLIEYFAAFKAAWRKYFPQYPYCEELYAYVDTEEKPFVRIYGNQLSSLRNETQLFEMLAGVNIKIALANGAANSKELLQLVHSQTSSLSRNLIPYFLDSRTKLLSRYHLDLDESIPFAPQMREAMLTFKRDLMYLHELLMEEITHRNQGNAVSAGERRRQQKSRNISELELLLAEKEAELQEAKRDLSYYQAMEAQDFKAEVSQYNRALTDLFRKLSDVNYGSVINELYLIALGGKEASAEEIRGLLRNMVFIFSSMGITPTETTKLGKKIMFYDDEANLDYAVDESKVKEGLNKGVLLYPGWKYKGNVLILPRLEICEPEKEGEEDV